jgi:hypothetical protein
MHRRELFRLLGAGAVLPAMSPELLSALHAAHPGEDYKLRSLGDHQNATVLAMIDQIIPETDTPGAKGAKVNEFIDLILTDWATPDEKKSFLDGLAWIDKKSTELYAKPFVETNAAQQESLLRAVDEVAMSDRHRPARHGNTVPDFDAQMKGPFWVVFKNITLHGYYTSQIGFEKELKQQIIPGSQHGCSPADAA